VRRKKQWAPDSADRELLTEHLFHEVQMTFFLAAQLAAPVTSRVDVSIRNAEIEACVLHLRELIDFFWGEHRRVRDDRAAFAADFFPRGEWERVRPERPAIMGKRLQLAPLAYDAAWEPPSEKVWDLVSQAFMLAAVVKRFVDAVDHRQFTPGFMNGMKICAEMFEHAHGGGQAGRSARAA
jgi:hypothetical protein